MADVANAHTTNLAKLESISSALASSPSTSSDLSVAVPPAATLNPLLSRTKLKPARKAKPKAKSKKTPLAGEVEQIKANELDVVSTGIRAAPDGEGDEGEVLDLADQLLEHLESIRVGKEEEKGKEKAVAKARPTSVGGPLHGFNEAMLGMLHIGNHAGHAVEPQEKNVPQEKEKKVSRQQARKIRKEVEHEELRQAAHAEVAETDDHAAEDERKSIDALCKKLDVWVKEIEPDGHCLFSAIADQVNFLQLTINGRKETYQSARTYAAQYMRTHPDEFLAFLETEDDGLMSPEEYAKYCDTVEKTAEWGGQPEITALSKYFRAPIHIVQAGTRLVKFGEDLPSGRGPLLISYHRKMYGLGEHYNSLRR